MLDTIRLGVPLTPLQHEQIMSLTAEDEDLQWVLFNPKSGDIHFRRVKGKTPTEENSYHRELRWEVPHDYIENECRLTLEFSVPKYWYGHNIHLLYDFATPLNHLRDLMNQRLEFKGKRKLVDTACWNVLRADFCYAWRFPSQKLAQRFLDSLKRLHFPRKKPIIYDDAILFVGKTYSVKVYLKLPEFKAHDRKELLKSGASLEWIDYCEKLADGVLRFEVTCRSQFLKRNDIQTVDDLVRPIHRVHWLEGTEPTTEFGKIFAVSLAAAIHRHDGEIGVTHLSWMDDLKILMDEAERYPDREPITMKFPGIDFDAMGSEEGEGFKQLLGVNRIDRGLITIQRRDNPTAIAKYLLTKFVGENAGMQRADEVKTKLLEVYKPVKAARLVSFWLYVQKFGSSEAKEIFGRDSYYYSVRELKKAGITLIEPPTGNNVTVLDRDFIQSFRMEIPSQYVTNKFDDFPEGSNILNFVPKLSGDNETA